MSRICPDCGESFEPPAEVCPYDGSSLQEESEPGAEHVGEVIDDRFRIDSVLGEGGMGRVYEATQLSVDRRVAVKLIRTENLEGEELEKRFYREAQVISDFSHPNIVRLIDFGEDDGLGVPYLVMEYIDGVVLTDLVEGHRLHPNFVLEVTSQVAAGLVEAHKADIVHRDLKTENILLVPVSPGGFQAKIIDFGIAFPRETAESLTTTGAICGTPQYLSPQQARGQEVGPPSDLYSLGVIMFEMTTGLLPFEADSTFDIMVKHVQEQAPPISTFVDSGTIPPELEELIGNLLAKQPEDRPASARKVREAVETVRSATGWSSIRLDDEERGLEEQLEPWILEPAERGERLVTEGYAGELQSDSAPNRPATDVTAPSDGPETSTAATGETRDEASRPSARVPVEETGGAAGTDPTRPPPTAEDRTAPETPGMQAGGEGSRPGTTPGRQSDSHADTGTGTARAAGTSPGTTSSGGSSWLLLGVSVVLVAALGALIAAVYVLQIKPSGDDPQPAAAAGGSADAGAKSPSAHAASGSAASGTATPDAGRSASGERPAGSGKSAGGTEPREGGRAGVESEDEADESGATESGATETAEKPADDGAGSGSGAESGASDEESAAVAPSGGGGAGAAPETESAQGSAESGGASGARESAPSGGSAETSGASAQAGGTDAPEDSDPSSGSTQGSGDDEASEIDEEYREATDFLEGGEL